VCRVLIVIVPRGSLPKLLNRSSVARNLPRPVYTVLAAEESLPPLLHDRHNFRTWEDGV